MKKAFCVIMWGIVYYLAGTYCQSHELISHPAYWSAFGGLFGVTLTYLLNYKEN
jgi:hypothetical protein